MSADFRCHTVGIDAGLQVCYVAQRIGQEGLGGGVGRGEYRMQVLHKLEARGGEGCQWLSRTTHHNFWSIYEQLQLQTFLNMEKAKAVIQCTIRGNQIFIKTCQGHWLCTRKAERKAKPRLTSTLMIGVALSIPELFSQRSCWESMKSLIKQPASTAGVKSDFGLEEAANEEEEACRNMITELMKGKNNRCPNPIYIKII